MNLFNLKPRVYLWYFKAFIAKRYKFIISGLIIGILLGFYWYSGYFLQFREVFGQENSIGIIGKYNLSNLPVNLQNKISLGLTRIIDGQATPSAGLSWQIKDNGKKYIFKLDNKLKWHDGKTFTSYDVNYRLKDVEIQAEDNQTVIFKLKEPFSSLTAIVSQPLFKKGLTGIGEFKVNNIVWKDGSIEKLDLQSLKSKEKLVYKFFINEKAAKTALQLKKVSRLQGIEDVSIFTPSSDFIITPIDNYQKIVALYYNTNKPPFDDKFIRNGLSYGVPDSIQIDYTKAMGPIPSTSRYFNNNLKNYSENTELAMKYLADLTDKESSQSSSFTIKLKTLFLYKNAADKIAESWNKIGISTAVGVADAKNSEDFDVFLAAIELFSDPDQYYIWHSSQKSNLTNLNNPRIDKLLEDGRRIIDENERKIKYQEFQKYLVEENPALFLYYAKTYTISRL